MQKQAPTVGRMLVAIGFALACFGLLLFLWVTFGGPTPFRAESYRFSAYFPEAITMSKETDVRIAGVSVGKVKEVSLPPDGNLTEAVIEIYPEYGPIPVDSRAVLRQKTLLGESYIELTSGSDDAGYIEDGGELEASQTVDATQIDEIFQALDPKTREAFQIWMQNSAPAIRNRGLNLNDALGNLGPFTTDATRVLQILREQDRALSGLVRDTGTVFEALSANDAALAGAIVNSNDAFEALASRDETLTEVIQIFPTFNEETRLTLNRLAEFAVDTSPLVRDLRPVARDLVPTLAAVSRLAPHLKRLFIELGPLIDVSEEGLPALRQVLDELAPLLAALDPFLANLNPVVRYINYYRTNVSDFLVNPPVGLGGTLPAVPGQPAPRHSLRQIGYFSQESLSIHPTRLPTNRGNGYLQPLSLNGRITARNLIFPNFTCENTATGGEIPASESSEARAACVVAPDFPAAFGGTHFPQIKADP